MTDVRHRFPLRFPSRLTLFFPLARAAWWASETLEAVGDWLEDIATAVEPRPLTFHLRKRSDAASLSGPGQLGAGTAPGRARTKPNQEERC